MEKRVQLFPGVIVPYSVALWIQYGGPDSDGIQQGGIGPVSNVKEESAGDVVDYWLRTIQRAKRVDRIKETCRHHDKGNEDRRPKPQLFALGEDDITAKLTEDDKHWGTNRILEQILGLSDGSSRTRFLMELKDGKYDDNYSKCFEGAEIVRTAFHLAQFYGLMENYSGNPQRRAKIFRAILDSVNKGSIQLTDALIDHFSLKEMPGLMSRYNPFRKLDALVPRKDVYTIASAMGTPGLMHLGCPALMSELGYKAIYHAGTPILYYMPKLK